MKEILRTQKQSLQARQSIDVDEKSLGKRVKSMLSGPELLAFTEISNISHDMHNAEIGYKNNDYQVYVATKCFTQKFRVVPMLLGPGQGKTYICLFLAIAHAKKGQKACIVVHSKVA